MPETVDKADGPGRPVFFDRQSLTADDLNAVIAWFRARMRRHNRHLLGAGVACGLAVEGVEGSPWQVRVSPGHAILPSGEEVHVPAPALFDTCAAARACLGIPGACPAPLDLDDTGGATPPRPGRVDFSDWPAGRVESLTLDGLSIRLGAATAPAGEARIRVLGLQRGLGLADRTEITPARPAERLVLRLARNAVAPTIIAFGADGAELDRLVMTGPALQPEVLTVEGPGIARVEILASGGEALLLGFEIPTEARGRVWLALAAKETPSRFLPALPEHCRPASDNHFPSRICEGFEFRILCAPPDPGLDCAAIDAILCGPAHLPCPPPVAEDCVVIATLTIGDGGILAIDEFSDRRRLPPLGLLGDRAACQCTVAPPPTPTPPPSPTPTPPPPSSIPPTVFTIPTILTVFPTRPTQVTIFTRLTLAPSQITLPTLRPSFILATRGPGGILVPGEEVINPAVLEADVSTIPGVGLVRAGALREAGITTVAEFSIRGSEELARIMGVSEVRIAGMRDEVEALATGRSR